MPNLLLVDDDPTMCELLAYTLGDAGFAVRQAADGAAALRQVEDEAPACIVLDLALPLLDGFELLALMRSRDLAPDTKVVVLSGRDDEAALVRAWELGVDAFLLKPVDPDAVVSRVEALIAPSAA